MNELVCQVCKKKFSGKDKIKKLEQHVLRSKRTHPKWVYYLEKYPIPLEIELENEKPKVKKVENPKIEEIDTSKLGDSEIKIDPNTGYAKIGDSGFSNTHLLVAVNSEDYNKMFIKNINDIFPRIHVHVCIMGPNASKLKSDVSDKLHTLIMLDAVGFNYSMCINVLLQSLYKKLPLSTVIIGDCWSVFSANKFVAEDIASINMDNSFLVIETTYNYKQDDNTGTHPHISTYIGVMVNKSRENKLSGDAIPLIATKTKHLFEIETGLEEEFFSEYSRMHTINQLEIAGLNKVIAQNGALCFRNKEKFSSSTKEARLINEIKENAEYNVFINSNFNSTWGNADKIGIMILKHNVPQWNHKTHKPNVRSLYDLNKVVESKPKEDVPWTGNEENRRRELTSKHDVLLLVDSTLPELLSSTPLIRGLFEKYGEIDILTDDKFESSIPLIKNYMIRKIYDINDIKYKMLNINKYGGNIIKSADCTITILDKTIKCIEAPDLGSDLASRNFAILDPIASSISNPFCNFKVCSEKISPDSIFISASTIEKDIKKNKLAIDQLGVVGSKLANSPTIHTLFATAPEETKLLDTTRYKPRKNIHIYDACSYFHLSGLLNRCKILVTISNSDLMWVGWALKKPTVVLITSDKDYIPLGDHMTSIKFEVNVPIVDDIVGKILKYL